MYPSPIKHCDVVTTTTHESLRGPCVGLILSDNQELFKQISTMLSSRFQDRPMINVMAATAVALLETEQSGYRIWSTIVVENAKTMAVTIQEQTGRCCFERNW